MRERGILIIDDMKTFDFDKVENVSVQYARTANEAKLFLETCGFDFVLFDNDLGPGQLEGYDLLKWAFHFELLNHVAIGVISNNIVARMNMQKLLQAYQLHPAGVFSNYLENLDTSLQSIPMWEW